MTEKDSGLFDEMHAAAYDKTSESLAPFKSALHILMRSILRELPERAHVLCVGAGTGAELLFLADAFPNWEFTALDISAPMLDVCRERVSSAGCAERCQMHVGPVSSLAAAASFDAATCILVSQFLTNLDERRELFEGIHARLRSGGLLVSADLSVDTDDIHHASILEIWRRTLEYSVLAEQQVNRPTTAPGSRVAVLPERAIEALIATAGFARPTRFFQAGLIHAWFTKRG